MRGPEAPLIKKPVYVMPNCTIHKAMHMVSPCVQKRDCSCHQQLSRYDLVVQLCAGLAPQLVARRQLGNGAVEQPSGVQVPRAAVASGHHIALRQRVENQVENGREALVKVGVNAPAEGHAATRGVVPLLGKLTVQPRRGVVVTHCTGDSTSKQSRIQCPRSKRCYMGTTANKKPARHQSVINININAYCRCHHQQHQHHPGLAP